MQETITISKKEYGALLATLSDAKEVCTNIKVKALILIGMFILLL